MKVPEFVSDLTAGWFSELLSASVSDVSINTLAAGSGLMSVVHRVTLNYESGEGPATLIVKLPTEVIQNREIAVQFDNFNREIEFYRQAASTTPMRTARVYFAESNGPDKFALVLEDLGDWDLGDQIVGCTLERCQGVMDTLAELHGSFWNRVDDGSLDWLPNNYPSVMSDGLYGGTEASWDNFTEVFADALTDEIRGAKTAYLAGLPGIQKSMNDSPRTIVHGDFRLDNLFFREEDGGLTVACCDFQAPVRGKGIQDVAYFLSGSVETDLRRNHEEALISRWLDNLYEQGVENYSYEDALLDYRKGILMVWTYAVIIGGGMSAENERGDTWVSHMIDRSVAALTDHDCLSLLV